MRQLLFLVGLMACLTVDAVTISGEVKSDEGTPLEFASVRVLNADSILVKGALSNASGAYRIELTNPGQYIVHVSLLGYKIQMQNVEATADVTLPTFVLERNAHTLGEVSVTANNITRVDNHLVVYPDQQSVKHSFTSYELLDNLMLPGIKVEPRDGKVTLFDKNVALFIDGEPADYRFVKNLRPRDVYKIEYFDAPSGKYAQYDAVINFITKASRRGGYMNLGATQYVGKTYGSYNAYTQYVFGKNKLHLFGGYSVSVRGLDRTSEEETFHFNDGEVSRDMPEVEGRHRINTEYGGLKYSRNSKSNIFSVTGQVVASRNRDRSHSLAYYTEPLNIVEDEFERSHATNISPKLNIWNHKGLTKNSFLQTTANIEYARNEKELFYDQNTESVMSNTKEDNLSVNGSLIYGLTLKNKHSITLQAHEYYQNSSAHYYGEFPSWQRLWRSEFLFFAEYNAQIKKVRVYVRPGISITNESHHGGLYTTVYNPRLFSQMTWTPRNNQQYSAFLAIGNGTPPLSNKTEGETVIDILQVRRGNPNLVEPKVYMAGLNYSLQLRKAYFMFSGQWNKIHNGPIRWYYLDRIVGFDDESTREVLVNSYRSGRIETFSANLTIGWNICKYLRAQAEGRFSHEVLGNYQNNQVSGQITLRGYYKDFSAKVYFVPTTKSLDNDYVFLHIRPQYGFSLDWNHKNWSAGAWIDNPFNRISAVANLHVPELSRICSVSQRRFAGLKVSYTFDFGSKTVVKEGNAEIKTGFNSAVVD